MPVKVVGSDVRTQDGVEHAEGVNVNINNGHLVVIATGPRTIAIYAPGQWLWAEVTK
jgi:hypothetical protein